MAINKNRRPQGTAQKVTAFIAGAADDLSPNAPRKYKTIGLQFNQYEYEQLAAVAAKTKRTKNSIIREGIEQIIDHLNSTK